MKWVQLFRTWVIIVALSILMIPISTPAAVVLSIIQTAIAITLVYNKASTIVIASLLTLLFIAMSVFPEIWIIIASAYPIMIYGLLCEKISTSLIVPSFTSTVAGITLFHWKYTQILHASHNDIGLTIGLLFLAVVVQNYVPIKLGETVGIGDPRKGRLQDDTGKTVKWKDKWPRAIDVTKNIRTKAREYITIVYTNGREWCMQDDFCEVKDKHIIYPAFDTEKGTMTFMTVLNNKITRITQYTPDVSWIAENKKPPTGTKIENLVNLEDLQVIYSTADSRNILAVTKNIKIKYKYGSDKVKISSKNEKIEVPLEEWNEDPEEYEDFFVF